MRFCYVTLTQPHVALGEFDDGGIAHAMERDDGFEGYTRVITFSLWQDDEFDVI